MLYAYSRLDGRQPQLIRWLSTPGGLVALLIGVSLLIRLAIASLTGLGIDESYMVAAGREFQLSYYDHPPLSWWLARGAALIAGTESPVAVRLPFILIFAVSTWLMYKLGERLFSAEAGMWAAAAMNLAPVLGLTTASWVLPDGPLLCALLGFALALVYGLEDGGWKYWIAAGVCGGLALLSKYTAALPLAGAGLYALTQREHRAWLTRPEPYAAALIAFILFLPVVIWNAQHEWASIAFQGGRALGMQINPLGPLKVLAGEALFLLPWLWAALMAVLIAAIRRGPDDRRAWLLVCLGTPLAVLIAVIALWSSQRIMYHWAAPGYALLLPLLGHAMAVRISAGSRLVPRAAGATAAFVLAGLLIAGLEFRYSLLSVQGTSQALDWTPLRGELLRLGLSGRAGEPTPVFAALGWQEAGKLGYGLGPDAEVICLSRDGRQFGIVRPLSAYTGREVVVATASPYLQREMPGGGLFRLIEKLEPFTLMHAGRPVLHIGLYRVLVTAE